MRAELRWMSSCEVWTVREAKERRSELQERHSPFAAGLYRNQSPLCFQRRPTAFIRNLNAFNNSPNQPVLQPDASVFAFQLSST